MSNIKLIMSRKAVIHFSEELRTVFLIISILNILTVTGFWKADQIAIITLGGLGLGLFHFIGSTNSYTHTLPIHSAITKLG